MICKFLINTLYRNFSKTINNIPKRPMMPFFIFRKEHFTEIKSDNPAMKSKDIMKKIGEKWRTLNDEERNAYLKQYHELKLNYTFELSKMNPDILQLEKEKKIANNALKSLKKKKKNLENLAIELNMPKRTVVNSFSVFIVEYKKKYPDTPLTFKAVSVEYNNLSNDEIERYKKIAKEANDAYDRDIRKWVAEMRYIGNTQSYRNMNDETKIELIDDLIKHTPPGGLNYVLNDLREIVNDDRILLSKAAPRSTAEYDRDQCIFVKVGNNEKYSMITNEAVYNNNYFDPRLCILFTYDHVNKTCKTVQDNFVDNQNQQTLSLRNEIDDVVDEYVDSHHCDGNCVVYDLSGKSIIFKIYIMSQEISESNFRSGRWRSQFSVTLESLTSKSFVIKGAVRAHVHGYESGNFQLVSWHNKEEKIKLGKKDSITSCIVNFIDKFESDYQESLNKEFNTISSTTFKALRRKLPVTKSLIDWQKIGAYNIN
ncbi:F-actin-capping protein subunit alpha [Intoshia linei]|uniref:F-actin-capping protein subunit alpha n=1 Tax=Intoshia linei TaxID=1819745 RepID=A0A177BA03_9BILA|nr:F-actin-capping protein subunit alpha [Intoshia linei]